MTTDGAGVVPRRHRLAARRLLAVMGVTEFKHTVELVGLAIDGVGVGVIVIGIAVSAGRFALALRAGGDGYRRLRQDLGRAILLGLEFLVAADIIRTVAVSPTIDNALVLGLIVLIRTFLSMSIQVELEGEWPWRRAAKHSNTGART